MKVTISLLLILILGIGIIGCSKDEDGSTVTEQSKDFRNARWGMSHEEVMASEDMSPTSNRTEVITYRGDFDGMMALIGYNFENEKLVRAGYLMMDSYEDPNYFIDDFERIKQKLIAKYGKPTSDQLLWKEGEAVEDDTSKFGEEVCSGKLFYLTTWETAKTLIKLRLDGQDGKCQLGIQFESIDLFVIPQIDSSMQQLAQPTPGP